MYALRCFRLGIRLSDLEGLSPEELADEAFEEVTARFQSRPESDSFAHLAIALPSVVGCPAYLLHYHPDFFGGNPSRETILSLGFAPDRTTLTESDLVRYASILRIQHLADAVAPPSVSDFFLSALGTLDPRSVEERAVSTIESSPFDADRAWFSSRLLHYVTMTDPHHWPFSFSNEYSTGSCFDLPSPDGPVVSAYVFTQLHF